MPLTRLGTLQFRVTTPMRVDVSGNTWALERTRVRPPKIALHVERWMQLSIFSSAGKRFAGGIWA